jgi:NitT/TauT family transport system substrate-binding protein
MLSSLPGETRAATVEIPVTFTWVMDGRLAWLYFGVQQGFFEQEGMNVKIHRGSGEYNAALAVDQGRFLFGVSIDTSTLVQMRTTKNDVRGIMVLESRPAMGYSAFADKGIRTPRDFEGRSIGLQPGSASEKVFPVLAKINGVDLAKVKIVSLSGDVYVPTFMAGRVDLISAWYNGFYPSLVHRLKK